MVAAGIVPEWAETLQRLHGRENLRRVGPAVSQMKPVRVLLDMAPVTWHDHEVQSIHFTRCAFLGVDRHRQFVRCMHGFSLCLWRLKR